MPSPVKVPASLNTHPSTITPFYLYIYAAPSSVMQAWRGLNNDIVKGYSTFCFVLPLPDNGIGTSTEISATDEDRDLGGAVIGPVEYFYSRLQSAGFKINKDMGALVRAATVTSFGGSGVPLDTTAITVLGTKKRSYAFDIELFSVDSGDSQRISDFMRLMHIYSTVSANKGSLYLNTPFVFSIDIVSAVTGDIVTSKWLPDPQPCALLNFSHNTVDFGQSFDNTYSARIIFRMVFAEIEPAVSDLESLDIKTMWEGLGKVAGTP
jgi:hypothetical protein